MMSRKYLLAAMAISGSGILLATLAHEDVTPSSADVLVVKGKEPHREAGIRDSPATPVQSSNNQIAKITMASDAEAIRADHELQVVDRDWATKAHRQLVDIFQSSANVSVDSIDCRSTTCKISGSIQNLTSANLGSTLEKIDGVNLASRLRQHGFEGQKGAEYEIISEAPLSLNYSRIVKDIRQ